MNKVARWREFGWRHDLWELLRFYRSLRAGGPAWLAHVVERNALSAGGVTVALEPTTVGALADYVRFATGELEVAFEALREEPAALAHCASLGVTVGKTKTKNLDHHQSPKAIVGAVNAIAERVCTERGETVNVNPQGRAVWLTERGLHVTARNLDGAVPGLVNPYLVWEIKEYWGTTKGGSKMSDAVYECQLVGRELREYESKAQVRLDHVVFVDGRSQWSVRRSDLMRFIDLFHQGLIDELVVGAQIETEWRPTLEAALARAAGA